MRKETLVAMDGLHEKILVDLARLEERRRDYFEAARYYEQARSQIGESLTQENEARLAEIDYRLGRCYKRIGRWRDAIEVQKASFEKFGKARNIEGQARALLELGHLYRLTNNFELARLHYKDARRLFRRSGDQRGLAMAQECLGTLELQLRLLPEAVRDLKEAKQAFAALGEPNGLKAIQDMIDLAEKEWVT
jgi:tetratricopeptide (TPR) repeat protein